MREKHFKLGRHPINRRAFLRGAGGVAVGLPFLEGLPERSAWAQDAQPTFVYFMVACHGIVADRFWPSATGALTLESMQADAKATSELAQYAPNLLMVNGIKYPGNLSNCGHAQGLVQCLTGVGPNGGGTSVQSNGISADMVISNELNPSGTDPLTLYAGRKFYIAERISFDGPGGPRSAEVNPYNIYRSIMGLSGSGGDGNMDPAEVDATAQELLTRRTSVNDLIREDLSALLARTDLSAEDRRRLELHVSAVRDIENAAMNVAQLGCEIEGVDVTAIEAMERLQVTTSGEQHESIVKLHSELVAFAFACNANRTATIQWGDGTDGTVYDVPSNSRKWGFHHVSHRMQSDGQAGNDATALEAHAEVDVVRMQTLRHVLDHFSQRGLLSHAAVVWTNHVSTRPDHSFRNIPYIIGGDAGGFLKQGEYVSLAVDGGGFGGSDGPTNDNILTTLIHAAGGTGSVGTGADIPELIATS